MSPAVDVIVDRDDHISTAHAAHGLAEVHPGVLVTSLAPDSRRGSTVAWAILSALGKRSDHLGAETPRWSDVVRWLAAYRIGELIVLRAQHLKPDSADKLHGIAAPGSVRLTLVYSGDRMPAQMPGATITLADLLARPRPARPATTTSRHRWPTVPRSHPLRLRYDCRNRLPDAEFRRVDDLLSTTCETMERWLAARPHAPRDAHAQAAAVLTAATDANQRHIRRSAVQIALMSVALAMPRSATGIRPRPLSDSAIDDVLAYTDVHVAALRLAEHVTGLGPDLLSLIGGDQITEDSILGCPVPERARVVLNALGQRTGLVLRRTTNGDSPLAGMRDADGASATPDFADEVLEIMGELLSGRGIRVRRTDVPEHLRSRLDALNADRVLELDNGTYRASHIAAWSTFRSCDPPPQPQ